MLVARDISKKWAVSMFDTAVIDLPREKLREYGRTRDISVLEIDTSTGMVPGTGQKATLFLLEPLKNQYRHLADKDGRNAHSYTAIFAAHVADMRNAPVEMRRDGGTLDPEAVLAFDNATIEEIAMIIIEAATGNGRGATIPFSLPGGYWAARLEVSAMLAKTASEMNAKMTENGTSKETEETDHSG